MPLPHLVLVAVTSTSGVWLEYDKGGSGISAPAPTPADDPCKVAAHPGLSFECVDLGTCPETEEAIRSATCYRREMKAARIDAARRKTEAEAPQPALVDPNPPAGYVHPLVFAGSAVVMLVGGVVLGFALGGGF